jgi:hypothetical protein
VKSSIDTTGFDDITSVTYDFNAMSEEARKIYDKYKSI